MTFFFNIGFTHKKFLTGRSMLEMLGVLSIIGLLSVGGVIGYRQAMASKKANDVIQYLSSISLQVSQQPNPFQNRSCNDYNQGRLEMPSFIQECKVTFNPATGIFLQVKYKEERLSSQLISALEARCSEQIYSTKINNNEQNFVWGDLTHTCGE